MYSDSVHLTDSGTQRFSYCYNLERKASNQHTEWDQGLAFLVKELCDEIFAKYIYINYKNNN